MHRVLARDAAYVSAATFQGRLFLTAAYPAAVSSPVPGDLVKGELYHLTCPERILAGIDRYEDFRPDDYAGSLFIRHVAPITLPDGRVLDAWIYLYNRPTVGLMLVRSGEFLPGSLAHPSDK